MLPPPVPLEGTRPLYVGGRAQKQFLMCSLQPLSCSQVQVLPRQGMVGPSSDSRPWLKETSAGSSSAVNGRACRRRRTPGGDWPAALANVQAATLRENCRLERAGTQEVIGLNRSRLHSTRPILNQYLWLVVHAVCGDGAGMWHHRGHGGAFRRERAILQQVALQIRIPGSQTTGKINRAEATTLSTR